MKKKRVLVCGASGFIGRNIYEALFKKDGIELFGTCFGDRFCNDTRLMDIDLTKQENVMNITAYMDIVIHAAAVTSGMNAVRENPARYVANNIVINTNLAEAAYRNKVPHFIFMSCTVMYQNSSKPLAEEEYSLNDILPEYYMGARIKIIMEDLCRFYSEIGNTKFTIIRPSSVYGPYDKYDLIRSHVFDGLIRRIVDAPEGSKIPINGLGNGERDFVHVFDLVQFIELLIDRPEAYKFEVYNVGSGVSISIKHLAEMMIKISGKNLGLFCDISKPSLENKLQIRIRKAQLLGWQPLIDLNKGIKETMEWYLKNLGGQVER